MQRITREQARKYAFDWRDEPLLRVRPGEPFEVETYDAGTGFFKTPADKAVPARVRILSVRCFAPCMCGRANQTSSPS